MAPLWGPIYARRGRKCLGGDRNVSVGTESSRETSAGPRVCSVGTESSREISAGPRVCTVGTESSREISAGLLMWIRPHRGSVGTEIDV